MWRSLKTIGTWARKALLTLSALEEAMDCRFENYAREQLYRLEERVAALERRPAK